MRLSKSSTSHRSVEISNRRPQRQSTLPAKSGVVVALLLGLTACGDDGPGRGQVGYVEGFYGGVVADEPRAAEIGRDVLTAGGSAADAAVAVYFAMSVTLPSSASLGGGGVCLVHDSKERKTEALLFLSKAPTAGPGQSGVPVAVPGNVRGMAALHARHGVFRWEQLVTPAERLARLGVPVSRALAREVQGANAALQQDPNTRRVFSNAAGNLIGEGDLWVQSDLAATLSNIRLKGGGDFHTGAMARHLSDAARNLGALLPIEDLRDQVPSWATPLSIKYGDHFAYFAPPPAVGGLLSAEIWRLLDYRSLYAGAAPSLRPHVMAEVTRRAYTERSNWLDNNDQMIEDPLAQLTDQRIAELMASYQPDRATPVSALPRLAQPRPPGAPAASFVTVDRFANAVACSVSTNSYFGAVRVAGDTGVLLGTAPGITGRGGGALGPMLVANVNTGDFYFAAAASGGAVAPTALAQVAGLSLLAERPLTEALRAPRLVNPGEPDIVYLEPGNAEVANDLRNRGNTVEELGPLGTVNAVLCAKGLRSQNTSCQIDFDPRGFGLALGAGAR